MLFVSLTILLGVWIPLFSVHFLVRWEWIAENLWIYPVTVVLIAIVMLKFCFFIQRDFN
jgi:hypothetical protein